MLALQAAAFVLLIGAVGIGASACLALVHVVRNSSLPTVAGIKLFGGGYFERRLWPRVFTALLVAFVIVCLLQILAGYLLMAHETSGAVLVLALLPFEIAFWIGFAMPYPPPVAAVRLVLLAFGWNALT